MQTQPRARRSARVVIGLPMYRSEECVAAVIESLLSLDYDDFAVVAVDDCSSDSTFEIAGRYAAADARLHLERNPRRLGMIANWNRTLELAYELHGDFEYFAWASDNDLRDPEWVSVLVRALEDDPRAVLAYTQFGTVVDGRKAVPGHGRWRFESKGIEEPLERLWSTAEGMRAGPIMYGLHRRATLDRVGGVPAVLLSDFVYLSQLSLFGTFVQVPEVLWYRDLSRRTGSATRRQRAALFAGRPPLLTYLPVSLQHALWLFAGLVVRGRLPEGIGRVGGLRISVSYLGNWWGRLAWRARRILGKRRKKLRKRFRRTLVARGRRMRKPAALRLLIRSRLGRGIRRMLGV